MAHRPLAAGGVPLVAQRLLEAGCCTRDAIDRDREDVRRGGRRRPTEAAGPGSAASAGHPAQADAAGWRSCAGIWRPTAAWSSWPATSERDHRGPGACVRRRGRRPSPPSRRADQRRRRRRDPQRGPGGGPGMREMLAVTAALVGRGAGRLRGAPHRRPLHRRHPRLHGRPRGPRGAAGGPIAAVRDGDTVVFDSTRESSTWSCPTTRSPPGWRRTGARPALQLRRAGQIRATRGLRRAGRSHELRPALRN